MYGGQTNYSGWSTSNTVSPVSNPNQVSNLQAARDTNTPTTIKVSWQKPSSGTTPTRYEVQYQSRTGNSGSWGNSWTSLPAVTHDDTTTTFTSQVTATEGGTGANSYRFQVRTVTVTGGDTIYGGWKTSSVVRAFDNPDQVQSLTASRHATTKTTINVTWAAPATNGTAPTNYDVSYQRDGGEWSDSTRQSATDRDYELTNATGASTFRFRVRTVTVSNNIPIEGSWAYSNTVSKLPAPGQAQNLTATRAANETVVDATWKAPDSNSSDTAPTHYEVQSQENGGSWLPTTPDRQAQSDKDYQLNGTAEADSSYRFRVRSVTVSGTGDKAGTILGSWAYSNTVPRLTAPGQVSNLTATRQAGDETKIDVSWTAPNNATGATRYDVQYKEDSDTNWSTAPNTTNLKATSYTLHDLADGGTVDGGSRYVFQVRGVTVVTGDDLVGSWRQSSAVRGLPAADVTGLSATRMADPTKIEVTWDMSARATGYDVQYRKDNGGWISAVTAANQPATSYTHENAGDNVTYTFRVRGVSDAGNGNWTDSNEVEPPKPGYHGGDVGVDWVTLKVTGGPWWYEFRKNGDWGGCVRVASGGVTITGLWPGVTHAANLYENSGCASADRIAGGVQVFKTLSDIYDWSMCWPRQGTDENGNAVYTDCRDIDNPDNFNQHTHKRSRLHTLGVNLSDCAFSREHHSHGWPSPGGGQHWHCPN